MFHSWAISEPYLINFPTIFSSLIFHISLPRIDFFFVEKRKPKIVGIKNDQKCDRKRNQENSHFYNELLISPKISGKLALKPGPL